MTIPLTAVILTFNEELNIKACLESISGWCESILVVDSGSTDGTLDICKQYPTQLLTHPYTDHASQWNWILNEVSFSTNWILALDADNIVSDDARKSIAQVVLRDDPSMGGYYLAHRHNFRGKHIRGLKSNWLRLVHRQRVQVDLSELVDFRFFTGYDIGFLTGEIIESNLKEMDIDFWIDKHQKFSSRMAMEEVLRCKGALAWNTTGKISGNSDQRMVFFKNIWYHLPLFFRPFLYFFYRYFIRFGFLDGANGFVFHFLQAFWFRFLVDIKIAELKRRLAKGELTVEDLLARVNHEK